MRITDTHTPGVVDADVDACDCTTGTVRLCALEVYAGRKLLGCIGDSGPRNYQLSNYRLNYDALSLTAPNARPTVAVIMGT